MTRLGDDHFWLLSAATAEWHDLDLLHEAEPPAGVTITNLSNTYNALMVAGPRAREVLGSVTDHPLDNTSFPWLSTREITIAETTVQALRVSFTGELGWELHFPTERSVEVYGALSAAGEPLGMIDFGLLATESMRDREELSGVEARAPHRVHRVWRRNSIDSSTSRRTSGVAMRSSPNANAGDRRLLVSFEVTNDEASAHTGDPIWAADELIGVVTSGGYGHTMNTNIAMGYVDPAFRARHRAGHRRDRRPLPGRRAPGAHVRPRPRTPTGLNRRPK